MLTYTLTYSFFLLYEYNIHLFVYLFFLKTSLMRPRRLVKSLLKELASWSGSFPAPEAYSASVLG